MKNELRGSPERDERRSIGIEPEGHNVWIFLLAIALVVAVSWWATGCAHLSERLVVTGADGSISEYRSSLWILGGGEAEFLSTADGTTAYSTSDTGLSDNGAEALGLIAEGAVRAMVPTP